MTDDEGNSRPRSLRPWWLMAVLPVICVATAYGSYRHPGDEYGLFFFGGVSPGLGVYILLERLGLWRPGDVAVAAGIAIVASGILVTLFAWFAVLLRARWWFIGVLWVIHFGALMRSSLGAYPTYARAMSKNGSLEAYVYASSNMGLYGSLLVCVIVVGLYRLYRLIRPKS